MEHFLGLILTGTPPVLVLIIGLTTLCDRKLSERSIGRLVQTVNIVGLTAALLLLASMLIHNERHVAITLGDWVHIQNFHFHIKLIFDRLSVPFVILTFALCGTVAAFAVRYLHREAGYHRFFMMYSIFVMGMIMTSAAGTIETLFTGWEFVGLSSAFLVAFFQERPSPVRNGLIVWTTYRVSDASLLVAAVALHHVTGQGDFDQLLSVASWPNGEVAADITSSQAFWIGMLFLISAAGKSALIPFSGWLPRAMEGPTPSSAVFYGALSVHLGVFLLMRFSPLFAESPALQWCVIAVGLSTALYASLVSWVQTDIKCALTFASLSQVGLIVAEIGMGWDYIPLVHTIGHACMRTLQFLRAPSLLIDNSALENAVGRRLPGQQSHWMSRLSPAWQRRLYRYGLERGSWDGWLHRFAVKPFLSTFRVCNRWEHQWTDWLNGVPSSAGRRASHPAETLGDSP